MAVKIKTQEKLLKIVSIKRAQLEPALAAHLRQRAQILQAISDIDAGLSGETIKPNQTGRADLGTGNFDLLQTLNLEKWNLQQSRKKQALLQELAGLEREISKLRLLLLENFKQDRLLKKMIKTTLQDQSDMRDAASDEALQMLVRP